MLDSRTRLAFLVDSVPALGGWLLQAARQRVHSRTALGPWRRTLFTTCYLSDWTMLGDARRSGPQRGALIPDTS